MLSGNGRSRDDGVIKFFPCIFPIPWKFFMSEFDQIPVLKLLNKAGNELRNRVRFSGCHLSLESSWTLVGRFVQSLMFFSFVSFYFPSILYTTHKTWMLVLLQNRDCSYLNQIWWPKILPVSSRNHSSNDKLNVVIDVDRLNWLVPRRYRCSTTFGVEQRVHDDLLNQAEQAVLDGTSKWSCKIACTGEAAIVSAYVRTTYAL